MVSNCGRHDGKRDRAVALQDNPGGGPMGTRRDLEPAGAGDVARVLLDAGDIQERVAALAAAVSRDYRGRDLLLVAVLKGAVMFIADLLRYLEVPAAVDFMAISSYGRSTRSSGVVRIIKDLNESIEGRDVLIVEDIIDTGLTLRYLFELLKDRHPRSIRICTLLDKQERRKAEVPVHYRGFSIPNEFVVGYGLDYGERYRNLPFIGVLRPEVYSSGE